MAATPEMRASDGDRDRVAAALREHMAEGRLDVDEFNERLERVYESRTYGELARLTVDLPEIDLHTLPATVGRSGDQPRPRDKGRAGLKAAWGVWATVSMINWAVWLVAIIGAGHLIYPWPLWVMGPWGIVLLMGTIFGDGQARRRS
ncbi:DUF1707 SHOCT-like domain-containing protein [Sphaerimonospora thailandensis]|uniref:DUF1707 domain-containing protein n=1 Tax=Sphaerimonospora thailandensis TaxID=795644 RepID=A0A8J3VY58_9ACTN|nr:DUF1707 domain-containing protein [Sphaerimonospora thailandensis]GIH69649.1 hypothetical protein Mth01_19020 [Sphaerimonospora thailandensis]